jgi:hypothetical protein
MTNELLIVTNVISREITGLDVVNSVSGFYSAAFDKLFQLVLALGVLFGVILPILIQFYQRRTVRAELAKQLEEKKTELLADIDKKFNAEKENISTSLKQNIATIEKRQNKAEGAVFRLQALNRTANDSLETCHDLCMAAEFFCKSDDGGDLIRTIKSLVEVLQKLTKEDLEKDGLGKRLEKILVELKKWNQNGLMFDLLTDFQNAIQETRNRKIVAK